MLLYVVMEFRLFFFPARLRRDTLISLALNLKNPPSRPYSQPTLI